MMSALLKLLVAMIVISSAQTASAESTRQELVVYRASFSLGSTSIYLANSPLGAESIHLSTSLLGAEVRIGVVGKAEDADIVINEVTSPLNAKGIYFAASPFQIPPSAQRPST